MKTSFYFVMWIIIYPILGLFNNQFIDNNSFIVALAVVWGLSWILDRSMPNIRNYENVSQFAPIMENIYTGNVSAFVKRLSTETKIETVTSIYFLVTTFVIAYVIFMAGVNDWIALIVFGFFTFGAISRSINFNKALTTVRDNPNPEQCAETASEIYKLDYAAYYEGRQSYAYEDMLPPRHSHFKLFQILSIIFAAICTILGLLYIVLAVYILCTGGTLASNAFATMYLLYGSLATYFGLKDAIITWRAMKQKDCSITTSLGSDEEQS